LMPALAHTEYSENAQITAIREDGKFLELGLRARGYDEIFVALNKYCESEEPKE